MTTIIHIDLEALDERLDHGKLWTTEWGDYTSPDGETCLHGAIRFCQPIPGDAYLIEQVGKRFGFGIEDNDNQESWDAVKATIIPDITDEMLLETFGPQWEPIVALVRRSAVLTADECNRLDASWAASGAASGVASGAASRAASWAASGDASWAASWAASRDASRAASWAASRDAAALCVRDLIGSHGFTQEHYDILTEAWATVIGKVHPDDVDRLVTP